MGKVAGAFALPALPLLVWRGERGRVPDEADDNCRYPLSGVEPRVAAAPEDVTEAVVPGDRGQHQLLAVEVLAVAEIIVVGVVDDDNLGHAATRAA